jgi:hypothetical protein
MKKILAVLAVGGLVFMARRRKASSTDAWAQGTDSI